MTGKVFAPGTLINVLASKRGREGLPLPAMAGLAAAEPLRERDEERGASTITIVEFEIAEDMDLRPLLSEDEGAGEEPFARFLEEDRVAIVWCEDRSRFYAKLQGICSCVCICYRPSAVRV